MITSADPFVGKSFKYLAIFDKSLRKFVVNSRPEDSILTVDYLIDILTPSVVDEIPTNLIQPCLSENTHKEILDKAKERVVVLLNTLHINYWTELTEVVFSRKKWDAISLIAAFLLLGTRRSSIIYHSLVELYVQLTILRTIEDNIDLSIRYEEVNSC